MLLPACSDRRVEEKCVLRQSVDPAGTPTRNVDGESARKGAGPAHAHKVGCKCANQAGQLISHAPPVATDNRPYLYASCIPVCWSGRRPSRAERMPILGPGSLARLGDTVRG